MLKQVPYRFIQNLLLLTFSFCTAVSYGQHDSLLQQQSLIHNKKKDIHIVVQPGKNSISYVNGDSSIYQRAIENNTINLGNYQRPAFKGNSALNALSIIINGAFTLTIDTIGTSCNYSNGSIVVVASGGVPPYSYTRSFGGFPFTQHTGNFRNLPAGTYTISVTDSSGLSVSTSLDLLNTMSTPHIASMSYVQPSQCSSFDGAFTLLGGGGVPPYTYSQDGLNYQPGNSFTNLSQGYYMNFVKDANGCASANNGSMFLTTNYYTNCFTLSLSHTSAACTNEGLLNVDAYNNSIPPFTFSLDGINYQSQHLFDSLPSGLKTIYFKDSLGTIEIFAIRIFQACADFKIITKNPSCSSNNATLTVIPSFGNAPYTYTLDGVNYQASNLFQSLSPGEYTVTVKDANGRISSTLLSFYEKCPVVNATSIDDICGQKDGSITATGSNGIQPYLYSIDGINFQISNTFTGLAKGSYTVTVKDSSGVTATTAVDVNTNCISMTCTISNTICNNSNGSIIVNVSNGTPPYLYSINGVNYQPANIFNNLPAGYYRVLVLDAANAKIDTTVSVINISGPKINTTITTPSCSKNNGTIQINASGGIAPLQYSLDNINFQGNNTFADLDSGKYTVYVNDAGGCQSTDTVFLTMLPVPTVSLGNDTSLCAGTSIVLTAPQLPGYSYLWNNNSTADNYQVSAAGKYFVKVTNQYNCTALDTIDISYKPLPGFSLGNDTTLCAGASVNISPVPVTTGTYLWNTGASSLTITANIAGLYWLQIENNGCIKRDTVNMNFKPVPVIALGKDTTLCLGDNHLLDVTNNGATYLWQDGTILPVYVVNRPGKYSVSVTKNGCDNSASVNIQYISKPTVNLGRDTAVCVMELISLNAQFPSSSYLWQDGSTSSFYSARTTGTYSVSVTNTCGVTNARIIISLASCACVFNIPSAFTPNNDGINDVFKPGYQCNYSKFEMRIYSRYGQLVFTSTNPLQGWNGYFKNELQPGGAFVYELKYKDNVAGSINHKKGTVILLH